jgi:hypothetical protein
MKTKHQILFILCLAIALRTFSQAEIQNPVFPFWKIKGNSGTTVGTNFIGTTDAQALMFKVNNQQAGYIDYATPFSTGFGYQTLNANTGINNAAFGYQALLSNTTANNNTAVGYFALKANTTGNANSAVGQGALQSNVSGVNNSAVGYQVLSNNTTGSSNTAVGFWAMRNSTTGFQNAAFGVNALNSNTTGYNNAAFGFYALQSATTASANTAVGYQSLTSNTTATNNTAVGFLSMISNTTGTSNTAVGSSALNGNDTGGNNTGVGINALQSNTTGSNNTALGSGANVASNNLSNATAIGYNAVVAASNTLVLGNGANVGIGISVPTSKLVVVGTGSAATIPNTTSSAVFRVGVSANEGIDFGKAGTSPYAGWIQSGFSGNADPLSIQPLGGNVGIGTIAPTQALDVNGKIRMQTGAVAGYVPVSDATGTMTWTSLGSTAWTLTGNSGTTAGTNFIGTTDAIDWVVKTNNTERLRVLSAGNVGIGTNAPVELLELAKNNADNYIRVDAGTPRCKLIRGKTL